MNTDLNTDNTGLGILSPAPHKKRAANTTKAVAAPHELPPRANTMVISAIDLERARLQAALIQRLEEKATKDITTTLGKSHGPGLEILLLPVGQRRMNLVEDYRPLPAIKAATDQAEKMCNWRIELYGFGQGAPPIGFDIQGDVVLGRGADADIDFDPYGAARYGVSRRHALLRPTSMHLYLIDLQSTNGTFYNSVPLGRAAARCIAHEDVITLGTLSFAIKIVDSPLEMPILFRGR
jgi:FHA domain-containing protein